MNKQKQDTNLLPFIPDGEFYFAKGIQAFQKQKFDVSLKWLTKAIEREPNNPLYNCQLSIVYTEIGKYHAANQLLNHVLETSDYVDCYYLLANNYAHLGLLNDARKYAEAYLDAETDGEFNEEAYFLMELIDFETEEEELDWLFEEEDDLLKYQETVFYMLENEEWKKALPFIEEMLLLFPDHHFIKHDYAQVLFRTGEEKRAIALEHKMQEETDSWLHSAINLAEFYYERKEIGKYKQIIQSLSNVWPFHTDQQIKLAVMFAKTDCYEKAYNRFRKIDKTIARGHLSYYKWFSISAYYLNKESVAKQLWEDGMQKHRALKNHITPWQFS
jgi:predicted Zn-dependent protease